MASTKILTCFLLVLCLKVASSTSLRRLQTSTDYLKRFQEAAEGRSANKGARVFYPVAYGADPSGEKDSRDAIMRAVREAFSVQHGKTLLTGINDLGGVVIDLQGGNYKITRPIVLPPGNGNVVIHGGSIRASSDFPTDRYLIELHAGAPEQQCVRSSYNQPENAEENVAANGGYQYEDITLRDVLLDSNFRGGGVHVVDAVRTRIDNCFFIHFNTKGIFVEGGHETFISSTFLGQHITAGGDPRERNFSGTAIDLASNDNVITDVAIFSAAVGVMLRGQANMLNGVHCYNKATFFGGVGIYVKLPGLGQTRIDNCYLDYTGIVLEDPVHVHVTNAFFLGDAFITLKSIKGKISGLNIVNNMFSGNGWGPIIHVDGKFNQIDQVVIDQNNVLKMKNKSTVARRKVEGQGTKFVADFSSDLVFPNRIKHVQYSYASDGNTRFPLLAVSSVSNNVVVVQSDEEVQGSVYVTVDQN